MAERRTFAPVVLLGLGSAGLAAMAGNQEWAAVTNTAPALVTDSDAGKVPLAGALALVVLAAWGVLLVTRGVVRRLVAVLGLIAALGVLGVTALGFSDAPDNLRRAVADLAYGQDAAVGRTGWYWLALAGAVVAVASSGAAAALVSSWPEMGSRYDAPGSAPPPRDETGLDLWRALDEGRDPTLPERRSTDP